MAENVENQTPKIVSTFMVTVNERGGMSFKDAAEEGQTPLSPADMADYIVSFGKTLEKFNEEERLRELIREESSDIIAKYIKAQKDLFQVIDKERAEKAEPKKKTPDVVV